MTKKELNDGYLSLLNLSQFCRVPWERRLFIGLLGELGYQSATIEQKIVIRHIATIETLLARILAGEEPSVERLTCLQRQIVSMLTTLQNWKRDRKPDRTQEKGLLECFNEQCETS